MSLPCGKCSFPIEERVIDDFGDTMTTPAMISGKSGHQDCLIAWAKAGVDLSCKNILGETVLMFVAERGMIRALRFLLRSGIFESMSAVTTTEAVNDGCNYLMTPLMRAVLRGKTNCVDLLIKEGGALVDLRDMCESTALFYASTDSCIESLKSAGADLNAVNIVGDTPLLLAIGQDLCHNVKYLIQAGANVNIANDNGFSPVMLCAAYGEYQTLKTLITSKADINVLGTNCEVTALIIAASQGFPDCVRFLLRSGAKINLPNQGTISANVAMYGDKPAQRSVCMMLLYAVGQILDDTESESAPEMIRSDNHKFLLKNGDHVLKHFCRKAIRKCLLSATPHTQVLYLVNYLEIPSVLKEYLVYDICM